MVKTNLEPLPPLSSKTQQPKFPSPKLSCFVQYVCRYLRRLNCPPRIFILYINPPNAYNGHPRNTAKLSLESAVHQHRQPHNLNIHPKLTAVLIKLYTEDPLQHVPGPLIARLSPLWFWNLTWRGIECRTITALKRCIIEKKKQKQDQCCQSTM